MTHSFFVRFDGHDDRDDSLCLCNLWGKEQLAVKLPDDFSVKNPRAPLYSWLFRQKLAFGLLSISTMTDTKLQEMWKICKCQLRVFTVFYLITRLFVTNPRDTFKTK